jgi:hypothetical protein
MAFGKGFKVVDLGKCGYKSKIVYKCNTLRLFGK